ncbi:MAG: hypothetical protein GX535_15160, partial [Xanthomonadaceae bacterium]|nr:hypothetical protein [Xanthomonadaceae bacterium]
MLRLIVLFLSLAAPNLHAADDAWIEESNRHAQVLLDVLARYTPETAA